MAFVQLAGFPGPAAALEPKVSVGQLIHAENRPYIHFDRKVPASEANFILSRTRLAVEKKCGEYTFNAAFQDYRYLFRRPASFGAISRTEFEIYNLNVEKTSFLGIESLEIKLGRTNLEYGSGLVIGDKNLAVVNLWDGARIRRRTRAGALDALSYSLKRDGESPAVFLHGLYFASSRIKGLEAYAIKKISHRRVAGENGGSDNVDITTFGYNYRRGFAGRFEANSETALQRGWWGPDAHSAFAAHFELNYDTRSKAGHVAGVEVNIASGDADPKDSKHGTFDGLWPSVYKKYGFTGYFCLQNIRDIAFTNRFRVRGNSFTLNFRKLDIFSPSDSIYYKDLTPVWGRRDRAGSSGTGIGFETDFCVSRRIGKGCFFEAGLANLKPGDFIKNTQKNFSPSGPDICDVNFTYMQIFKKW